MITRFYKMSLLTALALFFSFLAPAQKPGHEAIDSLLKDLVVAKEDTGKVQLLNKACLQLSYSDPKTATYYGHKAYLLAEKLKWEKGMAEATRYIAAIMVDAANEDSALYYLNSSYELYKELGDAEGMIANIYNTGAFQQHISHYSEAMASFFKGIDLAERSKNRTLLAKGYSLAATVLVQQKDFEKARQYSLKALNVFRTINQTDGVLECLEMIGYGYMMEKRLKEAKPYFIEALQLSDSIHNDLTKAKIYTQLVTYSEFNNEPDKRLEYLQKAQTIWDRIGPSSLYSIANIANIGSFYLDLYTQPGLLQQMPDSIKHNRSHFLEIAATQVSKAIELSKTEENPDLLSQLYELNAQVSEAKKDYKGALENFRSFVSIRDSMFSQENKNKIAAIEVSKELQLKDKTIALKKAENRQLWLYAALSLALVIIISVFFLNRYRLKQLRLKHEIQAKEAARKEQDLLHRNQLTQSELKAIRAQMNPHFIFNVLNSIESYIVDSDPKTAARMLQKTAGLCRLILENSTQNLVSADKEWKVLQLYAELESMRFSRQFNYSFERQNNCDLSAIFIPPLMLQPLVENAIHHGLRDDRITTPFLRVQVYTDTETVHFKIEDNGIGLKAAAEKRNNNLGKQKSIALSMIRERVSLINHISDKKLAAFTISEKEEKGTTGTVSQLTLPLNTFQ